MGHFLLIMPCKRFQLDGQHATLCLYAVCPDEFLSSQSPSVGHTARVTVEIATSLVFSRICFPILKQSSHLPPLAAAPGHSLPLPAGRARRTSRERERERVMDIGKLVSSVDCLASLTIVLLILLSYHSSVDIFVSAGLVSAQKTERADGLCASLVLPNRNYACQEFVAQTSDGFLLGVQRMWRPDLTQASSRQPVLLFHGILTGGDVWVLNPPGEGLGYIMADEGYDVWISNYRSTLFSYGHRSYKSSDRGYWDWSVDELASEDLPTALQLIYSETGQQVYLVSYSEGSQATLAAFSHGIGVNMVSKAVLMAPVSYLTSGPQLLYIASKLRLQRIYEALNIYELSTRSPGGRELVDLLCRESNVKCYQDWFRVFSGYICCINSTRRATIDQYETQATSIKNLDHYTQQVNGGTFAMYDYGEEENMNRYGQKTPPDYDISKFPSDRIRTMFISSSNDSLANTVDVAHLYQRLPSGFQRRTVQDFGHLDFVFGDTANRIVYDSVMEFLK